MTTLNRADRTDRAPDHTPASASTLEINTAIRAIIHDNAQSAPEYLRNLHSLRYINTILDISYLIRHAPNHIPDPADVKFIHSQQTHLVSEAIVTAPYIFPSGNPKYANSTSAIRYDWPQSNSAIIIVDLNEYQSRDGTQRTKKALIAYHLGSPIAIFIVKTAINPNTGIKVSHRRPKVSEYRIFSRIPGLLPTKDSD